MSYSSCIVCDAKYSAIGASMARSSSSVTVFWLYSLQSRAVSTSRAGRARKGARGSARAPCRRAGRRRRSRLASARSHGCGRCSRRGDVPRKPVCGKRVGVVMLATSTTSCIDTSTDCGRSVHQRGERGEGGFGPGVRVRSRFGAPDRRAVGIARWRTCWRRRPSRRDRSRASPTRGPLAPNGVMRTQTALGAADGSSAMQPGEARACRRRRRPRRAAPAARCRPPPARARPCLRSRPARRCRRGDRRSEGRLARPRRRDRRGCAPPAPRGHDRDRALAVRRGAVASRGHSSIRTPPTPVFVSSDVRSASSASRWIVRWCT